MLNYTDLTTVGTIGFNNESINHKRIPLSFWDINGYHIARHLWRYYVPLTDALIFVIDSSDRERLNEAVNEFKKLLTLDGLQTVPILIIRNKADIPNGLREAQIMAPLEIDKLVDHGKCHVESTCALTGEGLTECLDWIVDMLAWKSETL